MENLTHQHKRERIHKKYQEIPHPDSKIRFIDNLTSIISVTFPLTALPQIISIWLEKSVEGVSLLTWVLFLIFQIPLAIYSIIHKHKRMQLMFSLWCVVYVLVIVGILIYR
ncbi:hypothetical protein KAJ89_06050 [Candidatus Parcubacteria bacterium]|nr:hypothetical protein [Candidatus Parcubacteria bacterium]